MNFKISDKWSMDISLNELLLTATTCKINLDSRGHYETYNGILIYVTHPESETPFDIQLGVDETGIQYEGDFGCRKEYKEIPILQGLQILENYRQLILQRESLERLLYRNNLNKDRVIISIEE